MEVKRILCKYNIKPRKKLGQNFLISRRYLTKIIHCSHLTPRDTVVEIGAGIGNLTELLLKNASRVIAVEVDGRLISVLTEVLGQNPNLEILPADFLKIDLKKILAKNIKIVGNPPYYFASRLIEKLIAERKYFDCAYLSFQKEYVERMLARPGSKTYGRLSIFVQSFFDCQKLFPIPRQAFYPSPDVDSIFVRLVPQRDVKIDPYKLEVVTREFFSHRRKKISRIIRDSRVFVSVKMDTILKILDIDADSRPEVIPVEKYHKIAKFIKERR